MKTLERETIESLAEEFCQKYGFDHAKIDILFQKDIEQYILDNGEVYLNRVEHVALQPEEAEEAEIKVEVFEYPTDTFGQRARMTVRKITEGNIWHCLLMAVEDMFE